MSVGKAMLCMMEEQAVKCKATRGATQNADVKSIVCTAVFMIVRIGRVRSLLLWGCITGDRARCAVCLKLALAGQAVQAAQRTSACDCAIVRSTYCLLPTSLGLLIEYLVQVELRQTS